MTNEEKVKQLANEENGTFLPRTVAIERQCLQMAEWKDQQFKEAVARVRKWLYEHGKLDALDLVPVTGEIDINDEQAGFIKDFAENYGLPYYARTAILEAVGIKEDKKEGK